MGVLAMLQSIAKRYVAQRMYQELGFNLRDDEAVVTVACVITGRMGRVWWRGSDGLGSGGCFGIRRA